MLRAILQKDGFLGFFFIIIMLNLGNNISH